MAGSPHCRICPPPIPAPRHGFILVGVSVAGFECYGEVTQLSGGLKISPISHIRQPIRCEKRPKIVESSACRLCWQMFVDSYWVLGSGNTKCCWRPRDVKVLGIGIAFPGSKRRTLLDVARVTKIYDGFPLSPSRSPSGELKITHFHPKSASQPPVPCKPGDLDEAALDRVDL